MILVAFCFAGSACSDAGPPQEPPVAAVAEPTTTETDRPDATDDPAGWIGVVVPGESVEVSPNSLARLEAVLVEVGDRVDAGARLALIDRKPVEQDLAMAQASLTAARTEWQRSKVETTNAKSKYDRRSALADLVSQEEISEAQLEFEVAAAAVNVAESRVREQLAQVRQLQEMVAQTDIRAPFAGTISVRLADPGAMVGPGQPILKLSSDSQILRFAVPPQEAQRLAQNTPVRVECCTPRTEAVATIVSIAPEIDFASEMVIVEAHFLPGQERQLRAGQDVVVFLPTPPPGAPE